MTNQLKYKKLGVENRVVLFNSGLCAVRGTSMVAQALCVPGMHIHRYKDSDFSWWCNSTGGELVKPSSKPQGRQG
ncbi:hypothetical protein [Lewinella sp. LCG006]|uniref:hypothetical protein n=1 Tax=Lewinella sp. LCG006 TaxID=3231911 RepID=UPI003460327A